MKSTVATVTDLSDPEIIEQVLLGRTDLFGCLFDRYARRIFGYLWHFTNRKEDCEDFLQETFYKAYVNLKYCREREKFSSWLFAIAHNVAVSASKRLSFSYKKEIPLDTIMDTKDIASADDLNVELARAENIAKVRSAVDGMPAKYKEVAILFYYNELSLKEIGEVLALPVNTVKTRLYRCRKYLSHELRHEETMKPLSVSLVKSSLPPIE